MYSHNTLSSTTQKKSPTRFFLITHNFDEVIVTWCIWSGSSIQVLATSKIDTFIFNIFGLSID